MLAVIGECIPDPRDCKCCGKTYCGTECIECLNWRWNGENDIVLGFQPLFTLSQGQIHDQARKVINGGTYA